MRDLNRRTYLAAMGSSFAVFAGCNGRSDSETPTATANRETTQTQQSSTTTDRPPVLTTEPPTDVEYNSAVLHGSLDGLDNPSDIETGFEWRSNDSEWNETESAPEREFDAELTGLEPDVEHEYRAVATGSERVQGDLRQFTTERNVLTYDGGGTEAFRDVLREASERPGATIRFEEGHYSFDPLESYDINDPPGPHLQATGLEDITVEGNGSTISFTEPRMGGIHLFDSQDLTIRDLTVDYDPLPFTQGKIVDLADSRREFVFEIDDNHSPLSAEKFAQGDVFASIHDPDGSFIDSTRARGLPIKRFETIDSLGGDRWRLTLSEHSTTQGMTEGLRMAITARDPPGSAQALKFSNIDRPRLEDVTVNASPSFAALFANCRSPHVEGVRVAPPADSNRLIGSDADGLHFLNNRGGPTIRDCHVERLLDDGIIISSLMAPVERVDGDTVQVAPIGVFAPKVGDTIEAMTPRGVRSVELPDITSVSPKFRPSRGIAPVKSIEFESSVADHVEPGDYLANSTTANRGFVVQENTVRDNRANSVRISAGPGEITGNRFLSSQNQTINILCDTSGTYAPERWTNDVVIRENEVRASGKSYLGGGQPAGLLLVHAPGEGIKTEGRPHRNIEVSNNSFEDLGYRVGTLQDAERVTIERNDVTGVNELGYPYGREAFDLRNIDEAVFTRNTVSAASEYLEHFGRRDDVSTLETYKNEFRLDGNTAPATFE